MKNEIDTFLFGKYANKPVAEICESDPGYVIWWNENIKQFPLKGDDIFIASCRLKVKEKENEC